MKKISLLLIASSLLLTGCNQVSKHYDPYKIEDEEFANVYEGGKEDFHVHSWYESEAGAIDINENEDTGVVKVNYRKNVNFEYAHIYTTVLGPLADFTYVNFRAKGTPGKSVAIRVCYDPEDLETSNVLGNDVSFSLTEEYQTHTLKVKSIYRTRLDLAKRICIFPEIGQAGSSIRDAFTFEDFYFSKEIPEGATLENPGVDTGDTSVNVNGWKTQAWTFYTLYPIGGNTGVTYKNAAEWAYIEKDIDIAESHNHLKFTFENLPYDNDLSVTHIVFILRGDVSAHITEDVEYDYYTYYEETIYTYDLTKDNEVEPDEDGLITLDIPLTSALNTLKDHHEDGYRLTLLIESRPDDFDKFLYTREGNMIIHDTYTYEGEAAPIDYYSQYGESTYTLTDKEGVEKNITYTNVKGSAYWPRVCRRIDTNVGDSVYIKIHNNGTNAVRVGVHAGIFTDDRSDVKNNNFFPLYLNQGKNGDGYYMDGNTQDIEPGADLEVTVTVDEGTTHGVDASKDAIDVIQFLIDNCYGDSVSRSGNIDIVVVEIAH